MKTGLHLRQRFLFSIMTLFLGVASVFGQGDCWKKVLVGKGAVGGFVVGLTNDGKLFSWGNNYYGQLGIGTFENKNTPQQIGNALDWKSFALTSSSVVALKNNGSIWTWGNGESLADGTGVTKNTPQQVGIDKDWKEVYAGDFRIFAIKNNGTLWASGRNNSSSLGDGTNTIRYSFVKIGNDTDWKQISGGSSFTVGIKDNGSLWTWGSDDSGQLGNGDDFSIAPIPTKISIDNWISISSGSDHVIALQANGSIWSWGNNSFGQLGINSTSTRKLIPTKIGTELIWTNISAGFNHSTALKNGQVYVWGRNLHGALGTGYDENVVPKVISPGTNILVNNWRSIDNGSFSSSAVTYNGELYIWGNNLNGEMGNGTNYYNQLSPLKVNCPTNLASENQKSLQNLNIFPNPFKDKLLIATENKTITEVSIIDVSGKVIKKISNLKTKTYHLEASGLPAGNYLVSIKTDGGVETYKVIKK